MTLLLRKKTTEDYLKKISGEAYGTLSNKKMTVKTFSRFVQEKYETDPEKLCEELLGIKKQEGEDEFISSLYDMLQSWINWNVENKNAPYTIQTRFSNLREYLYHLGIRTNLQDVKQILKFPKRNKE